MQKADQVPKGLKAITYEVRDAEAIYTSQSLRSFDDGSDGH